MFKGDLRHSGGENASLEASMRFVAYLPHRKQVPIWINHRNNAKACVYSTGHKVISPKKISKATVVGENLPYVTMPTSTLFVLQKYQEYLFCSKQVHSISSKMMLFLLVYRQMSPRMQKTTAFLPRFLLGRGATTSLIMGEITRGKMRTAGSSE